MIRHSWKQLLNLVHHRVCLLICRAAILQHPAKYLGRPSANIQWAL